MRRAPAAVGRVGAGGRGAAARAGKSGERSGASSAAAAAAARLLRLEPAARVGRLVARGARERARKPRVALGVAGARLGGRCARAQVGGGREQQAERVARLQAEGQGLLPERAPKVHTSAALPLLLLLLLARRRLDHERLGLALQAGQLAHARARAVQPRTQVRRARLEARALLRVVVAAAAARRRLGGCNRGVELALEPGALGALGVKHRGQLDLLRRDAQRPIEVARGAAGGGALGRHAGSGRGGGRGGRAAAGGGGAGVGGAQHRAGGLREAAARVVGGEPLAAEALPLAGRLELLPARRPGGALAARVLCGRGGGGGGARRGARLGRGAARVGERLQDGKGAGTDGGLLLLLLRLLLAAPLAAAAFAALGLGPAVAGGRHRGRRLLLLIGGGGGGGGGGSRLLHCRRLRSGGQLARGGLPARLRAASAAATGRTAASGATRGGRAGRRRSGSSSSRGSDGGV